MLGCAEGRVMEVSHSEDIDSKRENVRTGGHRPLVGVRAGVQWVTAGGANSKHKPTRG